MERLLIYKPIWMGRGKRECFGIADYRLLGNDDIFVECDYTNKQGDKPFPYIYRINKSTARNYPIQNWHGIRLHIIPITNFETVIKVDPL